MPSVIMTLISIIALIRSFGRPVVCHPSSALYSLKLVSKVPLRWGTEIEVWDPPDLPPSLQLPPLPTFGHKSLAVLNNITELNGGTVSL